MLPILPDTTLVLPYEQRIYMETLIQFFQENHHKVYLLVTAPGMHMSVERTEFLVIHA